MITARGIRNNNPGNIRRVPGTTWAGESQTQSDPSFVVFSEPQYGIRAIARILRSYQRQGIDTIHEAINRWAPPNENNSVAYVDAVCKECAVGPDDNVKLESILPQLIKAIIRHENGGQPYSDEQIIEGILIA